MVLICSDTNICSNMVPRTGRGTDPTLSMGSCLCGFATPSALHTVWTFPWCQWRLALSWSTGGARRRGHARADPCVDGYVEHRQVDLMGESVLGRNRATGHRSSPGEIVQRSKPATSETALSRCGRFRRMRWSLPRIACSERRLRSDRIRRRRARIGSVRIRSESCPAAESWC